MYKVIVADNARYQDEDAWYTRGRFETEEEAIAECERITRASVLECGSYGAYTMFGEDPFIVVEDGATSTRDWSAWTFARQIATEAA